VPALGTVRVWCSAPGGGGTGITVGWPVRAVALGDGEAGAAAGEEIAGLAIAGRCCPAGVAT
jgi:hypothetical protein